VAAKLRTTLKKENVWEIIEHLGFPHGEKFNVIKPCTCFTFLKLAFLWARHGGGYL
jgi:hypothetical protein